MRRRNFIAGLVSTTAAWPLAARAQQGDRARRVGVLMNQADNDDAKVRLLAFREELGRLGWSEGQNLHIDYRFAGGGGTQYRSLAEELIALQPDVILSQSTTTTAALQRATKTVPIVFASVSDPIGAGFVANLARPGANITGALLYETGIMGKWLALLKEIAPQLKRAAVIGNPEVAPLDYFVRGAQAAAPALEVAVVPAPIENDDANIEHVIAAFAAEPNGGLIVTPDATAVTRRDLVIALASHHRLPAVYPYRLFVQAGGLMSYGVDQRDPFRLSASYVDRILCGAKPADLPVQAPTKYETVVNAKSANAIGLVVPASLQVRADEVIE